MTPNDPAQTNKVRFTPPPAADLMFERAYNVAAEIDVSLIGDRAKGTLLAALALGMDMLHHWPQAETAAAGWDQTLRDARVMSGRVDAEELKEQADQVAAPKLHQPAPAKDPAEANAHSPATGLTKLELFTLVLAAVASGPDVPPINQAEHANITAQILLGLPLNPRGGGA